MIVPERPEPAHERPAPEHPDWCDPEHCDESYHRGTPATIEGVRAGEPDISVQLQQAANEPLDTAPQTVLVTFDASYAVPDIRAYHLEPHQAIALHAELGRVATILAARNGERCAVDVWVPQRRPLGVYHRLLGDGRTACGVPAALYGHVVALGEALALSDEPCVHCFEPRSTRRHAERRQR